MLLLSSTALFAKGAEKPGKETTQVGAKDAPVRIGYFHGGRTYMLYRAYINGYFEKEGVAVELITRALRQKDLFKVPKSHEAFNALGKDMKFIGKATGTEIVDDIIDGKVHGGTIGEASFLKSISRGLPIVAVAGLGHDQKGAPAHAIIVRSGVEIKSPADFKGKTFASRRSGGIDEILLREFLKSEGISEKDLKIIDNLPEDEFHKGVKNGSIDVAYSHQQNIKNLTTGGYAYVYRRLDWVDPEASMAILVFHRDFVKNRRPEVQRIVNAYVRRIRYEKDLPEEERLKKNDEGLMMEDRDVKGMNIPQYDLPPLVKSDKLKGIHELMKKYRKIDKTVNIKDFIDNGFVETAAKQTR